MHVGAQLLGAQELADDRERLPQRNPVTALLGGMFAGSTATSWSWRAGSSRALAGKPAKPASLQPFAQQPHRFRVELPFDVERAGFADHDG